MNRKKIFPLIRSFLVLGLVFSFFGVPQLVHAQVTNSFEITFEQLGYAERLLEDPYSGVRYYFSLPSDWKPIDGTYTTLYMNFSYSGTPQVPYNSLTISLNGTLIQSTSFRNAGESSLTLALPVDLLYRPDTGLANMLEIELVSYVDCRTNADARVLLTIRNSSLLHFTYTIQAPSLDLKTFPAPLYFDQALLPSNVNIVLPEEPSQVELETALALAARLGASSRDNIPLSITYANNLTPVLAADQHLIIIGTPDTNPLITQIDLPISPKLRTLGLQSVLPAAVLPAEPFTMSILVKNTSQVPQTLVLRDRIPDGASLDCQDNCIQQSPGTFEWALGTLDVNQEVTIQATVTLDSAVFPNGSSFEHTATLIDENGQVVNGVSLTSPVDLTTTTTETVESQAAEGTYFFFQDDKAINEGDGIAQEVASPWNSGKVAIVLTGLSDEALQKAGQALATTTKFPGMSGDVALVKSAEYSAESTPELTDDITFSSLGYQDVEASYFSDLLQVNFDVPPGWAVDESAALMLHYSYSAALTTMFSALEIDINGLPVKSILLDSQETTDNLWATISIPKDHLHPGTNKLSILLISDYPECVSYKIAESFWARIFSDSYLHLPHTVIPVDYKLEQVPYILTVQHDLSDVIFALPAQTSQEQLQEMVRLASFLGYASSGSQFLPGVMQSDDSPENYPNSNIIAYGRPTESSVIPAVNDYLPQPFISGTDKILQSVDNIIYRMPDDYELGYIELISSPWNEEKVILVITGTSDQSVSWALDALINDQLNYKVTGNLSILTSATDIRSLDTRDISDAQVQILPAATQMPEAANTSTPASPPDATPTKVPESSRSPYLWPLLGLGLVLLVGTMYLLLRRK